MKICLKHLISAMFLICHFSMCDNVFEFNNKQITPYPHLYETCQGIPSPYLSSSGDEYVKVRFVNGKISYIPVTLSEKQKTIDSEDFPSLLSTGIHNEKELLDKRLITGRSIAEITVLGRPGRLSGSGFMAADEDIISVILGDNRRVAAMNLTHKQLAIPLFHITNTLDKDVGVLYRNHSFDGICSFDYNGRKVFLKGIGTKGGQESIFDDGITGALDLDIWRNLSDREIEFLRDSYPHMRYNEFMEMVDKLSHIHTGEMEPQYIMKYGFYEGHTEYRAEPLAIAFIFGLKSVEEIEACFKGNLDKVLTEHHKK